MPNTQHTQLNDRLNASIESQIYLSDAGQALRDAAEEAPIVSEATINQMVANIHFAGAINAGVISPKENLMGAVQKQYMEKRFPKAVDLCKRVYELRKKDVPDQEIQRQLHADLNATTSAVGATNSTGAIMAGIANKHDQNRKETGASVIEIMQSIARKTGG